MREYLSDAVDLYLNWRGSQSLGKRTLLNEKGVLKKFLTVTGNIYVSNIDERHVIRHFEEAGKTRSPSSLQLDHTVLGQFFDWARRTRRMDQMNDPMAGRRRPRAYRKERARVHVSQFSNLLDIGERNDKRDRMVMALLIYTLLRDQEIAGIRMADVDLESGYVIVRITKSHQEDRMPICAELDTELRSWMSHYHAEVGDRINAHSFLVPRRRTLSMERGERGRVLSHEMTYDPHLPIARIGKIASRVLAESGFPMTDSGGKTKMEGAHTIRRSGARALFDRLSEEGYDRALRLVQQTLHHSSMEMTERYIGISADRKTRDEILKGRPMYGAIDKSNVVRLTV